MARPNVTIPRFIRALLHDKSKDFLGFQWAKKGWIEFIPGNPRLVPRPYAVEILSMWRRSCTRVEFAELIGATANWVRHAVRKDQIQTVRVLVFIRIPRSEAPKARRLWEEARKNIVFPEKKGFARYGPELRRKKALEGRSRMEESGKTRGPISDEEREASSERLKLLHKEGRIPYMDSEQARRLALTRMKRQREREARKQEERARARHSKEVAARVMKSVRKRRRSSGQPGPKPKTETAPMSIYVPRTRIEKQKLGTKRMVTSFEAARFLGHSSEGLLKLPIRHEVVSGQVFYYAVSVEAYKARQVLTGKHRRQA